MQEEAFNTTVSRDFFRTFAGKQIGFGCYRRVYELIIDPSLVIKIEDEARSFNNIQEWDVWNRIKDTEHAMWLAPCKVISPCGTILLQKRTDIISYKDLPKSIPEWITDIKPDNWGYFEGRPVCHDYGFNLLMERGFSKKVRKVDWSYN